MAEGSEAASAAGPAANHRLYYGWFVVTGAFLTSFTSLGLVYSFGAFFTPLRQGFAVSHATVAGLFAATLFIKAIVGAVAGRLADRIGPRAVVAGSGVLLGAGLLLASRATAFWQLYLTFAIGLGLAAGSLYVTGLEVVQRWFQRRRSEASGFALSGVSLGNFALPPLAAVLIRAAGWRFTFAIFGVACLLLVLIAAALLSPSPESRGVPMEDRKAPAPDETGLPAAAGLTQGQAMRMRPFWLIYGAILAAALGYYIPFAVIVPDAERHGIHPVVAATLLGLIGAGSLAGRLVSVIADHVSRRRVWAAAFAGMSITFFWWLAAGSTVSLAVFALGFGVAGGVFFTLIGALAADYFGTRHAGALIGILLTALAPGSLLGPTLAGVAFDLQGSYLPAILVGALANLVALACVLALRSPAATRRTEA